MTQTTEKKQLTQDLDASDETSRSETNQSLHYIGFHISLDVKIKFILFNGTVQAKVSNVDNLVPVDLPEIPNQYNASSVTAKLKQLLRNFHLRPIYQSDPEKKVSFQLIPPEQKTWKKEDNVLNLPDDSVWICRRNGTISYAYANTVTTCDWNSDTSTVTSYQTMKITALGENNEDHLVVGDEQGNLFIDGQVLSTGKQVPIVNIIVLPLMIYLVKFEDNEEKLFHRQSTGLIPYLNSNTQTFRVLDNGAVVRWTENELNILEYDSAKNDYKEVFTHKDENIIDIHVIPYGKFLVVHKDGTETLWNVQETISMSKINDKYISKIAGGRTGQNLLLLDEKTLVHETRDKQRIKLRFYQQLENDQENLYQADAAGQWNIDSMILLSDGSIMYATNPTPSGIHVVTRNGKIVFTNHKELLDNQKVNALKELSDGSVAVICSQSIFVVKPEIRDMTENIDYQIELVRLNLQHNPADLELYSKLAKLYIQKQDQSNEKLYQLYLSGLQAAMNSNHLYKARRYYEKARQIKPWSNEPCEAFISYLEMTPHKKLRRRIHLDLFALTKNAENLPKNLTNRRCKTRLLIGERDFSFTEALINKHSFTHPNLSKAIIATELTAIHLEPHAAPQKQEKINLSKKRIINLTERGVKVLFDIDGTQIDRTFNGIVLMAN